MPIGPGKYDHLATCIRKETNAHAVVLIVLGGSKGSGFSVQAPLLDTFSVPEMLEQVAKEMRESFTKGKL